MLNRNSPTAHNRTRNSSIELLRIVAMALIVLSHACVHSGFQRSPDAMSLNSLFVQWGALGNLGADIYVLISGYFLCRKSEDRRSIIRLLLQVWFYSWLLFLICRFGFQHPYSLKDYLQSVFPVIFQEYWFFTAYIALRLFAPYINYFLEKADPKKHRDLLAVMFVLWVLVPTFTKQTMFGNQLSQFLFFYCVGAYFRRCPGAMQKHRAAMLWATVLSLLLMFASVVGLDYLGQSIALFQNRGRFFYERESLTVVICAIGMFALFAGGPSFSNSFVNAVASCAFGVYLIHDHPAVRSILWQKLFRHAERFDSPDLILRILISALLVFWGSTLIEYLRIRILATWFDGLSARIDKKLERFTRAWSK